MTSILSLLAFVAMSASWLIANHYPPWTSFYNDACMAMALLLLWLSTVFARPRVVPRLALLVASISLIPWLQWLSGLLAYSGDAWISTLYIAGLASAIAVAFQAQRVPATSLPTALAATILVAAIVSASLGLMQAFENWTFGMWIGDILTGMRSSANLAQSNNLATLIGWGAISLLLLREQGHLGRISGTVLLVLLLLGMAVTQSRTGLIFGPMILLGVWLAKRCGIRFRTGLLTVAAAVALGWFLTAASPFLMEKLLLSSLQTVAERMTGSLRFQVWPILVDGLSLKPWQGYGWLQVGAAELASADKFPPTGELYLHAHNFFFELVLWCGYPLGLALGGLVLYWFFSRLIKLATVEAVIAMLMLVTLGVHGMLEFPYQYAYFLLPAGLWIGIIEQQVRPHSGFETSTALLLPGLTTALFFAIVANYRAVEEDFRLVRFENLKVGSLRAEQPAPYAPFLSSLTSFLRFSRTAPASRMTDLQLDSMRRQVARYPYAASMYRFAMALAFNGRQEESRVLFIKARHIHGESMYKRLRANLKEAALENGAGQSAFQALEKSLPLY